MTRNVQQQVLINCECGEKTVAIFLFYIFSHFFCNTHIFELIRIKSITCAQLMTDIIDISFAFKSKNVLYTGKTLFLARSDFYHYI